MYGLWGYLLKAKALAPINARRVLEGGWYLKITSRHIFRFRIDYFIVFLDCVLHVLIWSWCHEWLKITKPYNVIMQVHLFPATPFNHCRKRIVLVPSTDSWHADCAHWWGSLFFSFSFLHNRNSIILQHQHQHQISISFPSTRFLSFVFLLLLLHHHNVEPTSTSQKIPHRP